MTVFSPSLPPVSWTTTRIASLFPGLPASPAASAVRPRKVGTLRPQVTRPEVFRKSRRVGDMISLRPLSLAKAVSPRFCKGQRTTDKGHVSVQLKLRQRQNQMAHRPDRVGGG